MGAARTRPSRNALARARSTRAVACTSETRWARSSAISVPLGSRISTPVPPRSTLITTRHSRGSSRSCSATTQLTSGSLPWTSAAADRNSTLRSGVGPGSSGWGAPSSHPNAEPLAIPKEAGDRPVTSWMMIARASASAAIRLPTIPMPRRASTTTGASVRVAAVSRTRSSASSTPGSAGTVDAVPPVSSSELTIVPRPMLTRTGSASSPRHHSDSCAPLARSIAGSRTTFTRAWSSPACSTRMRSCASSTSRANLCRSARSFLRP